MLYGFVFDGKNFALLENPRAAQTRLQAVNASGQIVGFSGPHGFIATAAHLLKPN